ncbi:MAG: isoprenylcysteine carboxylmethyltransferase family protein [Syntrophomonadaceae bacterium]|jgi:protein-S-isoprenylcysteine O-methyltransferase Ste14|nr:isoprenylcysteine carboxylmethyltransferase family protein [Syntrophomonadaceae bacterium]
MINTLVFILLGLFWFLFLGRTVMLTTRGIRVLVLAKGKSALEKLLEIIFIPALPLWTAQTASTALGGALIPAPPLWDAGVTGWVGVILCAAGLALFVSALISFGNAWRVGIDEAGSRLVTSGAFAISRNPIFLFMDIYFFGTFLVYPTLFFMLFFVFAALGIHMQILNEEKSLLSRFGSEYVEYRQKVRRYF